MVGTGFMNRIAPLPADYPQVVAGLGHKIVLGSDFPNIPYSYSHRDPGLGGMGPGRAVDARGPARHPLKLLQAVRNR